MITITREKHGKFNLPFFRNQKNEKKWENGKKKTGKHGKFNLPFFRNQKNEKSGKMVTSKNQHVIEYMSTLALTPNNDICVNEHYSNLH